MKRNKLFIAGIVTVFVALLSLTLVSSTLAKYTSTVSGADTATVAKWAWRYNGTELSATPAPLTFDLLETRYDSDGASAEADVKEGLIAPGTSGEFTIDIENLSEVTATYKIDFTVDENDVPLEWSIDGVNWTDELSDITTPVKLSMANTTDDTDIATVTVKWRWAFNGGDDANDTQLGLEQAVVSVTAQITFEQVD